MQDTPARGGAAGLDSGAPEAAPEQQGLDPGAGEAMQDTPVRGGAAGLNTGADIVGPAGAFPYTAESSAGDASMQSPGPNLDTGAAVAAVPADASPSAPSAAPPGCRHTQEDHPEVEEEDDLDLDAGEDEVMQATPGGGAADLDSGTDCTGPAGAFPYSAPMSSAGEGTMQGPGPYLAGGAADMEAAGSFPYSSASQSRVGEEAALASADDAALLAPGLAKATI